jgi:hypothetical protein
VNKKDVPVRSIYLNTVLTSQYPDRVLTRISSFVFCAFFVTKRWNARYYCSCVNRHLQDDAGGRGVLQTKLHTFYAQATENIACIFIVSTPYSQIDTLVHWIQSWCISPELCSFRTNGNAQVSLFTFVSKIRGSKEKRQYQDPRHKVLSGCQSACMDCYLYPVVWMNYSSMISVDNRLCEFERKVEIKKD